MGVDALRLKVAWIIDIYTSEIDQMLMLGYIKLPTSEEPLTEDLLIAAKTTTAPDAYDARTLMPTAVAGQAQQQGQCGSCYAFAAMTSYSWRLAINSAGRHNIAVAPASASACSNGCSGGNYMRVAEAMNRESGFGPDMCDPYTRDSQGRSTEQCSIGLPDACVASGVTSLKYTAQDFQTISSRFYNNGGLRTRYLPDLTGHMNTDSLIIELVMCRTNQEMQRLIEQEIADNGPVFISVNADPPFSGYTGYSILDMPSDTQQNHAIVALGWGEEAGVQYWIVQVCC